MKKLRKADMICNVPRKSWRKGKKRVVKACEGGKERIVHYGATGYKHDYSKVAKKNFRARHRCDVAEKGSKLTARYWACRDLWPKSRRAKKL
jgi:hypothetical protein